MRIVVTGSEGYMGGVVVPALRQHGHEVVGLDCGLFADCLLTEKPDVVTVRYDIRDESAELLRGADAVVHLAALSNDPIGNLDPEWTRQINLAATVRLAESAKAMGVRRFVFSSSCIMYGAMDGAVADETSALDPRTEYARSKVLAEQALMALAADGFSPVVLRNGTVYGLSPRMRLDTVFNDFLATAVRTSTVVVRGDGQEWRPVVDIRDVAAAFAAAVTAPEEVVHGQAFNTGADHVNHRILELAEVAAALVGNTTVEVRSEPGADRRSYRADFGKFATAFPNVRFRDVNEGGCDLVSALRRLAVVDQARYVRLAELRRLLDSGRLDATLRWKRCQ
jgi:nucleoside-diphosphate-sugar epimerase